MTKRIPQQFIDELLARCDLVALIDALVPLRKAGQNYTARCPFHEERTPSFTVSPAKQFYHCFGCGEKGNAIGFMQRYKNLEFREAIEYLAAQTGMELPQAMAVVTSNYAEYNQLYQLLDKVAEFYQQQLKQHPKAIAYLKQRGLSGQIAKHFRLGFAPAGWENLIKHFGASAEINEQLNRCGLLVRKEDGSFYDRFRERIIYPIRDSRGRIVGFGGRAIDSAVTPKYLNSPETVIFHKGKELYGLYEARQAQRELTQVLIVEGYMDVIALAQHGVNNAVATLGTATTPDHLKTLLRLSNELVFCFDGDQAGKTAAWRALETALPCLQDGVQISFMFLAEDEDPDSFVRQHGGAAVQARLSVAVPLSEFFFNNVGAQLNLNSIEGKARLAKPAGQLLAKIPEGVFRLRMFQRLAEIVRVDAEQLQRLAGLAPARSSAKTLKMPYHNRLAALPKRHSMVRLALALLIQEPQLAGQVSNLTVLKACELPGVALLVNVIELLQQQPQLTTGALLEHWRDQREYGQLAKLAVWSHAVPPNGLSKEFDDTLLRIKQVGLEQKIEFLLAKANSTGLSAGEKILLQQLIKASKA